MANRQRDEDDEQEAPKRGPQPPRLSVTVPKAVMKRVRLAAALADMEVNDWCRIVVLEAATRLVKKKYPNL